MPAPTKYETPEPGSTWKRKKDGVEVVVDHIYHGSATNRRFVAWIVPAEGRGSSDVIHLFLRLKKTCGAVAIPLIELTSLQLYLGAEKLRAPKVTHDGPEV